MSERRYSVSELDELRAAVESKYLWGSYMPDFCTNRMSRQYKEDEKNVAVEQMVRTHMIAGHTAEDLRASEKEREANGSPL